MKQLRCADAGFECEAVIQGENEQEVMAKGAEHAREVHGITEFDNATEDKLRSLIHDA